MILPEEDTIEVSAAAGDSSTDGDEVEAVFGACAELKDSAPSGPGGAGCRLSVVISPEVA